MRHAWRFGLWYCLLLGMTASLLAQEGRPRGEKEEAAETQDKAGQPEKPASRDETPTKVRGVVKEFRQTPKGDVHGLVLEDGTEVRFPPHVGAEVVTIVEAGDEVEISGRTHEGPKGDQHFRADQVANVNSKKSVTAGPPNQPGKRGPRDDAEPMIEKEDNPKPAGPPPHQQVLAELRDLRALLGDDIPRAKEDRFKGPPHEQMLAEIRAIRKLIDTTKGKAGGPKPKPKKKKDE